MLPNNHGGWLLPGRVIVFRGQFSFQMCMHTWRTCFDWMLIHPSIGVNGIGAWLTTLINVSNPTL